MWNIIGHEWATDLLRRAIVAGSDAHAYLISGPAGIGKSLLALRIAQALNCERGDGSPCTECRTCRRIAHGNHPDVRVAGMASQGATLKADEAARQKELKIDTVREWQRDINLRPYEATRRVFILHDAERLSEEAANAMLKTLEEPPSYASIILVANSSDLLATIVSRCQPLRLRPLPRRQVAQALIDEAHATPEDAALLAAWSAGRIGWALHLANHRDEMATRRTQVDTLIALHTMPRSESFRWAEERAKEYRGGEQATVFEWLELWQSWWRDLIMVAAGCPESITHIDRRDDLSTAAQRYELTQIYAFAARLSSATQQLRENVNPQLVFESLLIHLP